MLPKKFHIQSDVLKSLENVVMSFHVGLKHSGHTELDSVSVLQS